MDVKVNFSSHKRRSDHVRWLEDVHQRSQRIPVVPPLLKILIGRLAFVR
jgi:hypothetical protein